MTKSEKHEIACIVRCIINDECDEIKNAYKKVFGSLKGFRDYIRKECIEIWSNYEPYLDKEYLDIAWMKIGNKVINFDGIWCIIRDGLKFDASHMKNIA